MNVVHVVPINKVGEKPSSWRNSQINSLSIYLEKNLIYPVLNRVNPLNLFKEGFRLRTFLNKKNIDVVHVHWGSSLGLWAAIFSSVPVVVSFCGSDVMGSYNISKGKTMRGTLSQSLSKMAARLTSHNIVKSKILLNNLPKVAQKNTTIVPNGVDSSRFHPMSGESCREQLNLPRNKKIILFIGREDSGVKNPKMAYSIYRKIQLVDPDFHFLQIYGIDPEMMPLYFNAADYLLITSFHEGSSNALKEALFCNTPVISTPVGDAMERLQNIPGCLVSNNEEEIVQFLLHQKGKPFSAPRQAVEAVEIDFIAKKVLDVYQKALMK